MKKILFASCTVLMLAFVACDSNEPTTSEDDAMLLNMSPAKTSAPSTTPTGAVTPMATPAGTQQSVTAPATQAAKTAAMLNPAHGEPGHRCDIAVGAPLDSPPAAPTQPSSGGTVSPEVRKMQQTNPSQPTPTAAGMNPPHGEPGHKCEIPVGAPLNGAKK